MKGIRSLGKNSREDLQRVEGGIAIRIHETDLVSQMKTCSDGLQGAIDVVNNDSATPSSRGARATLMIRGRNALIQSTPFVFQWVAGSVRRCAESAGRLMCCSFR